MRAVLRRLSGLRLSPWQAAALLLLPLAAWAQPSDEPAPGREHHVTGGFTNRNPDAEPPARMDWLRWRWQAARAGLPPAPLREAPTVVPDLRFILANARAGSAMEPAVTWLGHATALLQVGGLNLLTDPMFSDSTSALPLAGARRAQPPALQPGQLPRVDVVLLSHDHAGHLDLPSLRALAAQPGGPPLAVVPLGLAGVVRSTGVAQVVELDWWQAHQIGEVELVLTPAQHWSGRGLLDRNSTLWGGFAVFAPQAQLFFVGATGYASDFVAIRERFAARQRGSGFDLALLPIGGYEPRWYQRTHRVNPEEAVRLHQDLGAKRSLGVYWGSFELGDEALDEPPLALAAARRKAGVRDNDFFVMAIGQTHRLPRRPAPE